MFDKMCLSPSTRETMSLTHDLTKFLEIVCASHAFPPSPLMTGVKLLSVEMVVLPSKY